MNDMSMDYRDRLLNLNILPLMMQYEISDIMFLVKCIKNPSNYFNISYSVHPTPVPLLILNSSIQYPKTTPFVSFILIAFPDCGILSLDLI